MTFVIFARFNLYRQYAIFVLHYKVKFALLFIVEIIEIVTMSAKLLSSKILIYGAIVDFCITSKYLYCNICSILAGQ